MNYLEDHVIMAPESDTSTSDCSKFNVLVADGAEVWGCVDTLLMVWGRSQ